LRLRAFAVQSVVCVIDVDAVHVSRHDRSAMNNRLRIAADIGGTFTDIALVHPDGRLATRKVASTPDDFARGVVEGAIELLGVERLRPEDIGTVLHACTVATNAILEGKGARTALVTTEGFRDVLELRRIRVPRLYDPLYVKPPVLAPRHLRFEVRERMGPRGEVIEPLDDASVERVIGKLRDAAVDAIAVCFLHSYANPDHERRVGERLRAAFPDAFLSLSVDVLPEIREYERTSTTVINSLVGPPVRAYLQSLVEQLGARSLPRDVLMMHSSGGIVDVRNVILRPAQIIECGPAAGVIGARHVGMQCGYANVISFDMGGTTAKASLIEDGALVRTDEYEVGGGISLSSRLVKGGGYALKLPVIDISEVGAGGGSVVWVDAGGALKVGPHSAGAVPGPACYGTGGIEPTVTDANVLLGYLNQMSLAGGAVPIVAGRSHAALHERVASRIGMDVIRAAHGVHEVVTTVMTRAVKTVTTFRGRDPREFALFAFGGNGGVHAVSLARSLGIGKVVVPPGAGVFSALGLLFADLEMGASTAWPARIGLMDPAALEARYQRLEEGLLRDMPSVAGGVRIVRRAGLRYAGQAFELDVPIDQPADARAVQAAVVAFEGEHERMYGHRLPGRPVEIVTLRSAVSAPTGGATRLAWQRDPARAAQRTERRAWYGDAIGWVTTPVVLRDAFDGSWRGGPCIVEEYEGTTVVPPGCRVRLDEFGNLVIAVEGAT